MPTANYKRNWYVLADRGDPRQDQYETTFPFPRWVILASGTTKRRAWQAAQKVRRSTPWRGQTMVVTRRALQATLMLCNGTDPHA